MPRQRRFFCLFKFERPSAIHQSSTAQEWMARRPRRCLLFDWSSDLWAHGVSGNDLCHWAADSSLPTTRRLWWQTRWQWVGWVDVTPWGRYFSKILRCYRFEPFQLENFHMILGYHYRRNSQQSTTQPVHWRCYSTHLQVTTGLFRSGIDGLWCAYRWIKSGGVGPINAGRSKKYDLFKESKTKQNRDRLNAFGWRLFH